MPYPLQIFCFSVSLLLAGCGGSGSSSDNEGDIQSNLVGAWNISSTYGQQVDEYYTVIRSNGTGSDFDYFGDSFDQGPNCYDKYDYTINALGSNQYEIDYGDGFPETVTLTVSGNTMTVTSDSNGTFSIPRLNLQESDFTPLCQ